MAKPNWYYYNGNTERIEVTTRELKNLVKAGVVKPDTIVVDPSGRKGRAENVNGLRFKEKDAETVENITDKTLEAFKTFAEEAAVNEMPKMETTPTVNYAEVSNHSVVMSSKFQCRKEQNLMKMVIVSSVVCIRRFKSAARSGYKMAA